MPIQRLKTAEEVRSSLTEQRLKQIRDMYARAYVDISKEIKKPGSDTRKLQAVRKDIVEHFESIDREIETQTKNDMRNICMTVVEDKKTCLSEYGFKERDIEKAFFYVPDRVVKAISSGSVYNDDWSLSTSIWGHSKRIQGDIDSIIAKGVASGKSTYDIAKDLEKYVNPNVEKKNQIIEFQKYKRDSQGNILKDKNGNPIPDGRKRSFYFGKCDYNASRLARTLISHAYQQSFEIVNEKDPFVTRYIWRASGQHGRTCSLCLERDGQLFKKDELPLDHPNGMCTFEAYIPYSDEYIDNKLKDWFRMPYGTYPEIDAYAATFLE